MGYTVPQMKEALYKAHTSGNQEHARLIAATLRREIDRQSTDEGAKWDLQQGIQPVSPETIIKQPEAEQPGFIDKALGVGEAALTTATGATTGFLTGAGRAVGQLGKEIVQGNYGSNEAAQRVQQAMSEGMQSGTYMPKTQSGMQNVEAIGEATEVLGALPPVMAEAQLISSAARQAAGYAPVFRQNAKTATQRLNESIAPIAQKAKQTLTRSPSSPDGGLSVGAAQNTKATVRKSEADGLMVPIRLTQGEADREDFTQRRFEEETAKTDAGAALRERRAESNLRLQQNFDAMIDDVGSNLSEDLPELGDFVVSNLRNSAAKSKKEYKAQYTKAKESGGLDANIDLNPVAQYLNDNRAGRGENSIMNKVQRQLEVLEIGKGDFTNGSLSIGDSKSPSGNITINQAEDVRRFINKYVDNTDPNDLRVASELKGIIDGITENAGNKAWQAAHKLRRGHAQNFENVSLIKNLIGTRKGTEERVIAVEDVLNKVVTSAGAKRDNLTHLRKLLLDSGEDGEQAWREVQGGTLAYLREKSLNAGSDTQGTKYFSHAKFKNAIASLRKSGKTEILFSPKVRQNLDLLEQVSEYVMSAPSGVINSSNTATVLGFIADMALLGSTGVPVPVVSATKAFTQHIKDRKLKAKINKALGVENEK